MTTPSDPRITFCDRMDNGIVIGFGDDKTAFYSVALLYGTLPQAQIMLSDDDDVWPPQETD
jgi:hypothetical protein